MWRAASTVVLLTLPFAACGGPRASLRPETPSTRVPLAQLWVDPGDTPRDLRWGIGGRALAPPPDALYALEGRDDSGFSQSYDVTAPDGVEWSAKVGPEAQTEVVVSRILWGLGYHQPPVYYLPSWTFVDERGRRRLATEARFRPKLSRLERSGEGWPWAGNPFTGAVEMRGLLVVLLMLNSTDLKDSNNSVYELEEPWDGAALGETGTLYPKRNWLEGFERSRFITRVTEDSVAFDYEGRHRHLLSTLRPGDVRWAAARMNRLTDRQLRDAFRAGNYAAPIAERFIRRIRARIADGLALRATPRLPDRP